MSGGKAERFTFRVNGTEHTLDADATTPLLDVLRNTLRLKGTRFGCGAEQCGACFVLVDGHAGSRTTGAMSGAAASSPLPGSLRGNRRLSQWLRFRADGLVEIFSGKVEIGQGILTALAQIAAEELDVSLAQVRMMPASTAMSPDEAMTSGSLSVQESGTALRHACAEARAIYLSAAAVRLGEPVETFSVDNGRILSTTGGDTSYWELVDNDLLDSDASGQVEPK